MSESNLFNTEITASLSEIKQIALSTPENQAILLLGSHGVGKTELVREIGRSLGMEVVIFDCTHIGDLGDILGFPSVKDGKTEYNPTYWYKPDHPVILFFDEVFRANNEVRGAIMTICLEQRIADKKLCRGSRVFAAGNPPEDGYDGVVPDAAQLSRYAVFRIKPDLAEWLKYAESIGVHPAFLKWLTDHPSDFISEIVDPEELKPMQTPRSWVLASNHLKALEASNTLDPRLVYLTLCAYVKPVTAQKLTEELTSQNLPVWQISGKERYFLNNANYKDIEEAIETLLKASTDHPDRLDEISSIFNALIKDMKSEDLAALLYNVLQYYLTTSDNAIYDIMNESSKSRIRELISNTSIESEGAESE